LELDELQLGVQLGPVVVGNAGFADDLDTIARSVEGMERYITVIEEWCAT
jgi:hypothetical protein